MHTKRRTKKLTNYRPQIYSGDIDVYGPEDQLIGFMALNNGY